MLATRKIVEKVIQRDRIRGVRLNSEIVKSVLLKKFSTFDTWSEFATTRGNKDVYRNAVTAKEQDLTT